MAISQDLVLKVAAAGTRLHPGLTKVPRVAEFNNHLQSYVVFILFYFSQKISQASYLGRVIQNAKELRK